jgi:hypothetical protein
VTHRQTNKQTGEEEEEERRRRREEGGGVIGAERQGRK